MGLLLTSNTTATGSAIHPPLAKASEWVQRWSHCVAAGGTVLDVACGFGRHLRWFHSRNHPVFGVDISSTAIESVAHLGEMVLADIEAGPWPFATTGPMATGLRQFDAVVVCNYLWRPLFPHILNSVAPGGVLLYETFAIGNETVGKPSRPDFLLNTGELLHVCRSFKTVAYEDAYLENPARFVQRIVAIKPKFGS